MKCKVVTPSSLIGDVRTPRRFAVKDDVRSIDAQVRDLQGGRGHTCPTSADDDAAWVCVIEDKGEPDAVGAGNPKAALGALKAPLHLVPPALELYAADGLGEGAGKYGPYNWREPGKGVKMSTYIGAIKRHLFAMMDGEDVDPDSANGKTHLAGLAANLAILCDAHAGGFMTDDRPQPGPAPRLVLKKKEA